MELILYVSDCMTICRMIIQHESNSSSLLYIEQGRAASEPCYTDCNDNLNIRISVEKLCEISNLFPSRNVNISKTLLLSWAMGTSIFTSAMSCEKSFSQSFFTSSISSQYRRVRGYKYQNWFQSKPTVSQIDMSDRQTRRRTRESGRQTDRESSRKTD